MIIGIYVVQRITESAFSESDIAPVAVDVETVDVAVFQGYVINVIVAEYSPMRHSLQTADSAVVNVLHGDSVAHFVVVGIGSLDGDVGKQYLG